MRHFHPGLIGAGLRRYSVPSTCAHYGLTTDYYNADNPSLPWHSMGSWRHEGFDSMQHSLLSVRIAIPVHPY